MRLSRKIQNPERHQQQENQQAEANAQQMEHRPPLHAAAGHRIADLKPEPLVRHPLAQAFVEILQLLGFHDSGRFAAAEVKPALSGEARENCLAPPPRSPTTRPVEANDYKVRLEIFEGPLDLLLYLIKKDEVDIHSISIERITRQYLDYINTFKLLNIDLASEFIVMAANLMYLKSRTLLPARRSTARGGRRGGRSALGTHPPAHRIQEIQGRRRIPLTARTRTGRPLRPPTGRRGRCPRKKPPRSPRFPFSISSAPSRMS